MQLATTFYALHQEPSLAHFTAPPFQKREGIVSEASHHHIMEEL